MFPDMKNAMVDDNKAYYEKVTLQTEWLVEHLALEASEAYKLWGVYNEELTSKQQALATALLALSTNRLVLTMLRIETTLDEIQLAIS